MFEALAGEQHPVTRKSFLKFSATSAARLAAGCGSTSTGSAQAAKGAASKKQLLVALSGGPATLDPQTTIAGTDWISLANIYDGLFMRDYTSARFRSRRSRAWRPRIRYPETDGRIRSSFGPA